MEVLGRGGSQVDGGRVWIENHPVEGWIPGRVDSVAANGCYVVVDDNGQQFEVPQDKARPVDKACLRGVEDLLALGDFNEGGLLHNVRVRFSRDDIYTGIGNPILISINPFAKLPGLYSEQKQKMYRDASAAAGNSDTGLPPHLYSVGAASFTAMLAEGQNQSIIISGESGAGKTEATKKILHYFASLQGAPGEGQQSIEDQVLKANPILEGFGNAKTVRNNNSSRFGKYIDIQFDTAGKLKSARISSYLLEKSRIVKQQPEERGYHVFYQMCAAANEGSHQDWIASLGLLSASEHEYTYGTTDIPGVDDTADFTEMFSCMQSLGFSDDERASVFHIAASVLHLGDLDFTENENSNDGSRICDTTKAAQICKLLKLDEKAFAKVFQFRTLEDPFTHKIIDMPQKEQDASNTRQSMAKCFYSRLFEWLVWRINESTKAKEVTAAKNCKKVGILDIYGFEVFEWNSFEQICINFANEKLQQHFNSHMFTLEQQLYTEEGITWSHIKWQDNREIIETLEKKPVGLFPILDSECLMPNGNDSNCLGKIWNIFKSHKTIYKPSRFADTRFAIAHYAGEVIYDIVGFLEKNMDKLHNDITMLGKSSSMPLLKLLFSDPKFAPELDPPPAAGRSTTPVRGATPTRGATPVRSTTPTRGAVAGGAGARPRQNVTVSMMFRTQLDQLVEDLNQTHPRYIRCIKPNANKVPQEFDSVDVQRQLRCAGMLESIRIRRAGYSVRRPFKEFYNRFRILCPGVTVPRGASPDFKDLSHQLLNKLEARFEKEKSPMEEKSWQIGRSRVFMKETLQERLEKCMSTALQIYVIRMQKRWRCYRARKYFLESRKLAALLQAGLRTLRAASAFRCKKHRLHWASTKIQRTFRGWKSRQRIGKLKGQMAAERIQKLREEDERKAELLAAKKAAEEKKRAEEELQRKLEQQKVEELKRQAEFEKQQEAERQHNMQEELLSLRAENAALSKKAAAAHADPAELLALKAENEDLRVQLQLTQTRNDALEQGEEVLRKELKELRAERQRLEGEVLNAQDTLEMERTKGSAVAAMELASLKVRTQTLEAELDASTTYAERLQEQLLEKTKTEGASRTDSLDNIRAELLAKIESQPPTKPITTMDALRLPLGTAALGTSALGTSGLGTSALGTTDLRMSIQPGDRKSLMNQRMLFESLKRQFNEAITPRGVRESFEEDAEGARVQSSDDNDLVRQLRKEHAELGTQIACLEQELKDKVEEASTSIQTNSELQAEVQDLRMQLKHAQAKTWMIQEHEAQIRHLEEEQDSWRRRVEQSQKAKSESDINSKGMEFENKRLREELNEITSKWKTARECVSRLTRMQRENDPDDMRQEMEKFKRQAEYFEREFKRSKQLNMDMSGVLEKMPDAWLSSVQTM